MDDFQIFFERLRKTNAILSYFTDFDKVRANTNKIRIKLNQLNYILGHQDLETAVMELWDENPSVFKVLPELVAVRVNENRPTLNKRGETQYMDEYFDTVEGVMEFIEGTGLKNVFQSSEIASLVDYVFGVEVGLDTNGRKNRGGNIMVDIVSKIFDDNGVNYRREVSKAEFPEIVSLGYDSKRFDFVIETKYKTYLIETNFYNSSGSKLNEVARAYIEISPKINRYRKYAFCWITDGQGWIPAKKQLREAFEAIPNLYNLETIGKLIKQVEITDKYDI